MDELRGDRDDDAPEESFAALLEQSLAGAGELEPGRLIGAKILKIGAEWVFLDVGQKGEGVLDIKELLDADGVLTVSTGDTVQAYFLGRDESELRFTTRIGGGGSGTAQLERAWKAGIPVEGRLEREIKGGYEVRLPGNVRAFCPYSQLGRGRQESSEELAGQTLSFLITQFGEKGPNIVVSRRAILEEEQRRRREALITSLKVGMTVTGTVTNILRYGAFIDIGGVEGLLPISEAGWGRTADLAELLHVGQSVEVEVKSIDWEKDRIGLSLRSAAADPWVRVGTNYTQGSTHNGTVARLTPFGAFVTLEPGIDGLLHISKLGEGRRINHPREVLREGQQIAVTIEEADLDRRRLALAPASQGAEVVDTTAYVGPPASMGTLGELLRASLEKKT